MDSLVNTVPVLKENFGVCSSAETICCFWERCLARYEEINLSSGGKIKELK